MEKINNALDVAGKWGIFNLNNTFLKVLNNDQNDYTTRDMPVWTGSLDTAMIFDTKEDADAYLNLNSMFVGYGLITGQMIVQMHTTSNTPQAYGNNLKVLVTKEPWVDSYLNKPIEICSSLDNLDEYETKPYTSIPRAGMVLEFFIHK